MMRAAVMRDSIIVVDDIPAPTPGSGEVLVKTLARSIVAACSLNALVYWV